MTRKENLKRTLEFLQKKRSNCYNTQAEFYDIAIVCVEKELRYYHGCSDVKEFYNDDGEVE